MYKLFIVRHGETDWNVQGRMQGWTDIPLNAVGMSQARRIAERLSCEPAFTVLYGSPLQRAWQTAEMIGRAVGLKPIPEPALKERCLGEIEGLTMPDIEDRYPEWYRQWRSGASHLPFPSEEARELFQARVRGFLGELEARHSEGRILLVTHGGTLGLIMAMVMGLDLERHFPFWFDNACLNIVDYGERGPRVSALNDTCHLRNHAPPRTAEQELALDDRTEIKETALNDSVE